MIKNAIGGILLFLVFFCLIIATICDVKYYFYNGEEDASIGSRFGWRSAFLFLVIYIKFFN